MHRSTYAQAPFSGSLACLERINSMQTRARVHRVPCDAMCNHRAMCTQNKKTGTHTCTATAVQWHVRDEGCRVQESQEVHQNQAARLSAHMDKQAALTARKHTALPICTAGGPIQRLAFHLPGQNLHAAWHARKQPRWAAPGKPLGEPRDSTLGEAQAAAASGPPAAHTYILAPTYLPLPPRPAPAGEPSCQHIAIASQVTHMPTCLGRRRAQTGARNARRSPSSRHGTPPPMPHHTRWPHHTPSPTITITIISSCRRLRTSPSVRSAPLG